MQAATTRAPEPATTQASGLYPPSQPAKSEGSRKIPAPSMELAMSATRLQRPMVRTKSVRAGPDCGAESKRCPSLRRAGLGRPALGDLGQQVRAAGGLEVGVALAPVVVDRKGLEVVFVLDQQRDRLARALGC